MRWIPNGTNMCSWLRSDQMAESRHLLCSLMANELGRPRSGAAGIGSITSQRLLPVQSLVVCTNEVTERHCPTPAADEFIERTSEKSARELLPLVLDLVKPGSII